MNPFSFDEQTNSWSYQGRKVYAYGGSIEEPTRFYDPSTLRFLTPEGVWLPYTFHAATDLFQPSDQPHAVVLLNPLTIPTQVTVKQILDFVRSSTLLDTTTRAIPIEGAKPLHPSASEGTTDPLGPTSIEITDLMGRNTEIDVGGLAWALSLSSPQAVARNLNIILRDAGLRLF